MTTISRASVGANEQRRIFHSPAGTNVILINLNGAQNANYNCSSDATLRHIEPLAGKYIGTNLTEVTLFGQEHGSDVMLIISDDVMVWID